MKPALSVPLLGAAVVAVGALAYRLGQSRCQPARVTAGTSPAEPTEAIPSTLPDATEAFNGLLDRLRAQGF